MGIENLQGITGIPGCRARSRKWILSLLPILAVGSALVTFPSLARDATAEPDSRVSAATRPAPGGLEMGRLDSASGMAEGEAMLASEVSTAYDVLLTLDGAAVADALERGVPRARQGRHRYTLGEEAYRDLAAAGADLTLLGGVTLHRFSTASAQGAAVTGKDVPEDEVRPPSVANSAGSFYASSGLLDDPVPSYGWLARWLQVDGAAAAPPGSVTTSLRYRLRLHGDADPQNFYAYSYAFYLSSEARGGAVPHFLVYDRLGGSTDGGQDDDAEDDSDIYLNLRSTDHFQGEDPNQRWYVYVQNHYGGSALLQYFELEVSWQTPEVDLRAMEVFFQTAPGESGSRVESPLPGRSVYPHFAFAVDSLIPVTGTWTLDLDGSPLCDFAGTFQPGFWVGSCSTPVSLVAGANVLHGRIDLTGEPSETDGSNNDASRGYPLADEPEIRIEPTELNVTGSGTDGPPAVAGARRVESGAAGLPAADRSGQAALVEKAQREGKVRVIVRLDTPFEPEGRIPGAHGVQQQRQSIRQAQEEVLRALAGSGATVHGRFRTIPFLALEVSPAALDRLIALRRVVGVEEDRPVPPSLASSLPVIGVPTAWAYGFTGEGQVVAVLDTGVDKAHPFFSTGSEKVVSEACYSSTGSYSTSVCPGGVSESTAAGSGEECAVEIDGCDHGTHVAGIVAGNDGAGPDYGVARDAGIIAIQVFSRFEGFDCYPGPAPCALSWVSDVVKGLERVYEIRDSFEIAAVNMSLGGGVYSSESSCDAGNASTKAAIDNLLSVGIPTVVSSGNHAATDGLSAPGCISSAVSVGATNDGDEIASFSNVAPFLDLLAPGVSIDSSVPGGGLANLSGTSMAAPHVAGAWALLREAAPGASVAEVLQVLREASVRVNDTRIGGWVTDLRRVDLDEALGGLTPNGQALTLYNDGGGVLAVTSLELDPAVGWITLSRQAPFDVAPGGSQELVVTVDFDAAPLGESAYRLLVGSSDADEDPYPDGVFITVRKLEPCYALTRAHTGSGSDPVASPTRSSGCPVGQYNAGTSIQLTAAPTLNWAVESWSGTDDDASTAAANTLTMPAAGHAVSVSYLRTVFPSILLVDDDDNLPDVQPYYRTALDALGLAYDVWDTGNSDNEPEAAALSSYSTVIWFTGHEFGGVAGPGSTGETSLASFLDTGGKCLFLSAQDYLYDRGVTPFATGRLGVQNVAHDLPLPSFLLGQGSAFEGLGSYSPAPFFAWFGDVLQRTPQAESAFLGDFGSSGVSKIGGNDRTVFLAFPWEALPTAQARQDVLAAGLDFCAAVFADVAPRYWARDWIEAIYQAGITLGCGTNPLRYCPAGVVAREQMAAFLIRALEGEAYVPPPCTAAPFSDVPAGNPFCPWIRDLVERGITLGCGGGKYCPDDPVNRAQMAIFLVRSLEGAGYVPEPCTEPPFSDVPVSSGACPWIRDLAARSITNGCGGGRFCIGQATSRAEMAVFLARAFNLPLP